MDVEDAYLAISGYFDLWVRLMEYRTRVMEGRHVPAADGSMLIVSPPTDRGIRILSRANAGGRTDMLCFSEALAAKASSYAAKQGARNITFKTSPFFSIPSRDASYDVIFANCFFDFCSEMDLPAILRELRRALRAEGRLFAVYMDHPRGVAGRLWAFVLKKFRRLSGGSHPVGLEPFLGPAGLEVEEDLRLTRFGFPIRYLRLGARPNDHDDLPW